MGRTLNCVGGVALPSPSAVGNGQWNELSLLRVMGVGNGEYGRKMNDSLAGSRECA